MTRKEYIALCQRIAVLPVTSGGVPASIPPELIVNYDGIRYYPYAFEIIFNKDGTYQDRAILHDLKANSIIHCNLERVAR